MWTSLEWHDDLAAESAAPSTTGGAPARTRRGSSERSRTVVLVISAPPKLVDPEPTWWSTTSRAGAVVADVGAGCLLPHGARLHLQTGGGGSGGTTTIDRAGVVAVVLLDVAQEDWTRNGPRLLRRWRPRTVGDLKLKEEGDNESDEQREHTVHGGRALRHPVLACCAA